MSTETREHHDRICNRVALGVGVAAFAVYAATLCTGAYPGDSATLLVQHSGYAPFPALTHMAWGWIVRALKAIPAGALSFKLSLLSAVCGGLAVALLFRLVSDLAAISFHRRPANWIRQGAGRERGEAEIEASILARHNPVNQLVVRLVSGLLAAATLALSAPFWIAATRAHTGAFDVVWALFVALAILRYFEGGSVVWLCASGMAYGALVAEAPSMVVFSPVCLILTMWAMFRHEHLAIRWFDEGRTGPSVTGYAFLCAIFVLAGLALPLAAEAWRLGRLPAAEWVGVATFPRALVEVLRAAWNELKGDVPQLGWLLLPLVTVIPVAMVASAIRSLLPTPGASAYWTGLVLAILAVAVAFHVPFAPWPMFRATPLYVTPYAVFAAWAGLAAGVIVQLLLVDLTRFNVPKLLAPAIANERRRRGIAAALVAIYAIPMLVAGAMNLRVADGRLARPFNEFAQRVVAECKGLESLVTRGAIDDLIMVAAAESKSPLRLINLRMGRHEPYLRYVATLFPNDPRLKGLAAAGMEPLMAEWFTRDPKVPEKVGVFDVPDLWLNAGYKIVPGHLVYRGATNSVAPPQDCEAWSVEVAAMRGRFERCTLPAREWGTWMILHASRLMNDRGVAAEESGVDAEAAGWYEAAIAAAGDNVSARLNRLRLARRIGRPEVAKLESDMMDFLRSRGGSVDSIWASQVYGQIRSPEAMIERGARMAVSGRLQPALAGFVHAMELGEAREQTLISLAKLLAARGRMQEGRAILDQLLEREPTNVIARLALADHAMQSGDLATARKSLESLAGEKSVERSVRLGLAFLASLEGNPMAGAQAVDERLRQNPDDSEAWTLSAVMALQRGDVVGVRKAYDALQRLNRRSPQASYAMAWVLLQEGKAFEGRRMLEELTLHSPAFTPGWESLARLDYAERKRDLAANHIHQLLQLDPGNALANQFLASFQIEQGRYAEAEASLRVALERKRDPTVLNDLAWALLNRGSAITALPFIEEAVRLQPKASALQDTLGMVLLALNRPEEARAALRKAAELAPDDLSIKSHIGDMERKIGKGR